MGEQGFVLNDGGSDDEFFYKPSPRRKSGSMQRCYEQIQVDIEGARKVVMALG